MIFMAPAFKAKMKSIKTNDLRDWADNPAASKMVPISPETLRAIADELDQLRELKSRFELFGWAVSGLGWVYRGDYSEVDAKAEARRCGGSAEAFPLYRMAPK